MDYFMSQCLLTGKVVCCHFFLRDRIAYNLRGLCNTRYIISRAVILFTKFEE